MSELETLRAQANALRERINAVESEESYKRNKTLVGKCFKYRNCYSLPQTESDYWWMYAKVTGLDKYGGPVVFMFQRDKNGNFHIDSENAHINENYKQITDKQLRHAWRTFASMMNSEARLADVLP